LARFVRPGLHHRPRIRVVGQPVAHPDPFARPATQHEPTRAGEVHAFGDPGHRPDIAADIAAADLAALGNQHNTETRIVVAHAVPYQRGVARLEDLHRQILVGQQRRLEWEHRHRGGFG